MSYKNLPEFIKVLEQNEELLRIIAPVSSCLEIAEITDRVSKLNGGGKALLFERVDGCSFPVLTNAFGSEKRMALALGTDSLDDLADRLTALFEQNIPKTGRDKFRVLKLAVEFSRYLPRHVTMSCPPCQETIKRDDDVDLSTIPVLRSWPQDGGPFITLPIVITKDLRTGKRNVGMYRMQVFSRNTAGMHWHLHKDGSHIFRDYEKSGQRMEVAVAIGTDPVVTYAATAPLPRGIDELLLAGFIRRKPVTLVPAATVNLDVPAEAEIVLEGYVDPQERQCEGPFGDHTGYYSLPDLYPVFHVTAITHRRNAVYSATVVGRPPMEDCYLAMASERIFLPLLRTLLPEIRDIRLPWEGVFHNIVIVSIDKAYPGQARKVMYGLWGSGQMSFSKAIIVIDGSIPLHDGSKLLQLILSRLDVKRDIFITEGILDVLDHSAPSACWGGKIGIDMTDATDGEAPRRQLGTGRNPDAGTIMNLVTAYDDGFLACRVIFADACYPLFIFAIRKEPEKRSSFFRNILLAHAIINQGIVLFYDDNIDIQDNDLILWKAFNNVDPIRDISLGETVTIIDATTKNLSDGHPRPWPDDAVSNETTKRCVDARLKELGLHNLFPGNI